MEQIPLPPVSFPTSNSPSRLDAHPQRDYQCWESWSYLDLLAMNEKPKVSPSGRLICDSCQSLYEEVGDLAREAHTFAKVRRTDDSLVCKPNDTEHNAVYRVTVTDAHNAVHIGLYTPDRWLSESIETDLVHADDTIEELLEEECLDRGYDAKLHVEHFRNPDKEFVFRSAIPLPKGEKMDGEAMISRVSRALLAYQAVFSKLGDLKPAE